MSNKPSKTPDPSPAELLTFEEIKLELARRFPFFVLVTLRQAEDTPAGEEFRIAYNQSPTLCLGLLDRGRRELFEVLTEGEYRREN